MNSLPALRRRPFAIRRPLRSLLELFIVPLLALAVAASLPARAATALADQPIFAAANAPGNLALALSVEFPTAISVAHTNRTYAPASQYLGYFDPDKCYTYNYDANTPINNYFIPSSAANNHVCSGKWSGNFLNWATMQTIDPFRWALTGGYRVIDDPALTVVEKAWGTTQGGYNNFPNSSIDSTTIAGATPFASFNSMNMRIWGLGNKMRFTLPDTSPAPAVSFAAKYWNNTTQTGNPTLSRTDKAINFNWDSGSPDASINHDNISAQWKATISIPTTGNYQFRVRADDTVKLTVAGTVEVNQTSYDGLQNHQSATYYKVVGSTLDIQVDFTQGGGGSSVVLEWLKPGSTIWTVVGGGPGDLSGPSANSYNPGTTAVGAATYEVFVRAKVCDSSIGIESNCTKYGSNYKPEGLMQKYANKIRYSAFGYLNDGNILRDGGVLRAQQKFAGPTKPVPGSTPVTNPAAEWDSATGVFVLNPDSADATATAGIMGIPSGTVTNSGVLNYLNKFGEVTPGSYKTYDNVSELYYAAIRYFKNLQAVPEWTAAGTSSQADRIVWTDGFPVITSPVDPILYSCQRNFILGIGDVNTHADKNVPGRLASQTGSEPALPAAVSGDTSVNAVSRTDQIGALENLGNIGSNATYNTAAIAGLAYDAHVNDIRGRPTSSSLPNPQTVDTYWVDVQENQVYKDYNQFYLATKYGGFTVPAGYLMSNTTPLPESAWHTNTDILSSANKRPDNYFSGGRPDLMKAGLDAAFAKIADAIGAYTTSFATSLPQIATSGNASYSAQYDAKNWTGELTANTLSFDATAGATTLVQQWNGKKFTDILTTQLAGTGWSTARRVLTWAGTAGTGVAFRANTSGGTTTQIATGDVGAFDTSYVAGDDSVDYVNYLRGDQTNEIGSTAKSGKPVYRARAKLLGDIVGSKATPVGPPSFPFSDATNPGYAAFKSTWATRRTVVYFGANDGMLHAVNGALTDSSSATPPLETDANYGKEMFAYVPRELFLGPTRPTTATSPSTDGLASLGSPSFAHHYMVDATPNINDVDFARVPNSAKARQNPAATTSDWRSVLIGGLGKGGRAYYALDVTDPVSMATSGTEDTAAAKVLWEFSNSTTGMSGEMGFSYGDPLVMKTKKYGWVVMFVSGYNNADGVGYFFFVNPKTGALLEKVSTGAGSTAADAGLAHANAFIVDATDGTADAVYAGDLLGNVWRLDVTSTTGTYSDSGKLVKFAVLTDASSAANRQPVTSRPSIEVSPTSKKRYLMIGTGRLLDATDVSSTQGQTFYAIADGTNAAFNATPFPPNASPAYPIVRSQLTENTDVTDKLSFDPATKLGWFEELGLDPGTAANPNATPPVTAVASTGIAFRIVTDMTAASGSVAFASTLPNGSVCSPSGISRVYARDYATAQTTLGTNLSYLALTSVATDLHYVSVGGKLRLLAGTKDGGNPQVVPITPGLPFGLRRLNWRELQVVD